MKNKMTLIEAQSIFEIRSTESISRSVLKKIYKRAMFKLHPDRGGDKLKTQLLNEAYALLKTVVSLDVDGPRLEETKPLDTHSDDWLFDKNAGHPLHDSGLSSLKTRHELLNELFDIRDEGNVPDIRYWDQSEVYHSNSNQGIYFQKEDMAMKLQYLLGERDYITLVDVTNGFLHRKKAGKMTVAVKRYGESYGPNQECLSNVLIEWFEERGERSHGFHWCDFYKEVIDKVSTAFRSGDLKGEVFGRAFTLATPSWLLWEATVMVGESIIKIGFDEYSSKNEFNPFNLGAIKPLKALPKKWKVADLVKVLINGQFHSLKQNYYYTDDYALDAAVGFRRGYIENPLEMAMRWHGDTLRSCSSLYSSSDDKRINFGKHMNDGCSLVVDLDNRYPLISLEGDVIRLEQALKLQVA
ncbi:hypothetical protein NB545_19680 [Vibrio campbellii]|uniref:hypothetical protein n=1 Tax=Vibrio harveyi group TaxID=717610 RepID=UPI0018F23F64|nr:MULTISPECIES: hypothetical protein [Vibrio harveyi group]MCR9909658.1 hypothetical protein [Vibrio campbellii]